MVIRLGLRLNLLGDKSFLFSSLLSILASDMNAADETTAMVSERCSVCTNEGERMAFLQLPFLGYIDAVDNLILLIILPNEKFRN
jgi:hypothetical protein